MKFLVLSFTVRLEMSPMFLTLIWVYLTRGSETETSNVLLMCCFTKLPSPISSLDTVLQFHNVKTHINSPPVWDLWIQIAENLCEMWSDPLCCEFFLCLTLVLMPDGGDWSLVMVDYLSLPLLYFSGKKGWSGSCGAACCESPWKKTARGSECSVPPSCPGKCHQPVTRISNRR